MQFLLFTCATYNSFFLSLISLSHELQPRFHHDEIFSSEEPNRDQSSSFTAWPQDSNIVTTAGINQRPCSSTALWQETHSANKRWEEEGEALDLAFLVHEAWVLGLEEWKHGSDIMSAALSRKEHTTFKANTWTVMVRMAFGYPWSGCIAYFLETAHD